METITLNNGLQIPKLWFWVFQITNPEECENAVLEALKIGYRLIDTAASYGNEEIVWKAIKKSWIPREEIFLTTKLWIQDANYEKAKLAFEKSIKNLWIDYLDLYLIHQPYNDVYGAWRAMEELYKDWKIKAIWVSNFNPDRIMDLMLYNKVKPAVNQIEIHPFHNQEKNIEFLKSNWVQAEAWWPFAEWKNNIFENEILKQIASKYHKSVSQVILRWNLERDIVVIPKSVKPERIKENFEVFDFKLSKEDIDLINKLDEWKSLFFEKTDPEVVKWLSTYKINI
jgi:2,5-diketo-D-gluconate reductase A